MTVRWLKNLSPPGWSGLMGCVILEPSLGLAQEGQEEREWCNYPTSSLHAAQRVCRNCLTAATRGLASLSASQKPGQAPRLSAGVLSTGVCSPGHKRNASAGPHSSPSWQEAPHAIAAAHLQLYQALQVDTGCGNDSLILVAPLAKIFLGTATTDKNMHYNLCQDSGKFAIAT